MRNRAKLGLAIIAVVAACAGCASNGSPPPLTATPASPPPPVTPSSSTTPSLFDTPEYQRSSLSQVNVIPAYEAGATGQGVLVAVVDTGIDVQNPEFAGRIDSRSADLVISGVVQPEDVRPGGPSLQDVDGHGTAVAGILAAGKNDIATHGVAFDAKLLVFRADKEGDSSTLFGDAIAEGAHRAATYGARVLNLSLGSTDPGARGDFDNLFNFTSSHDIVAAIAAGNDGAANPEGSALAAIDAQARGSVIVVGSVGATNTMSSFSNRAGSAANFYIVAPGETVRTTKLGGGGLTTTYFQGTSASTPFVSGAAALIRQLWPTLTAAQVVDILLNSATDLGAPGVDPIYGHGLLNIGAAVSPVGAMSTSSVSGGSILIDGEAGATSPAFSSGVHGLGDFVFLDRYGRDFHASLDSFMLSPTDTRIDPALYVRPYTTFRTGRKDLVGGTAYFQMRSDDLAFTDPAAAFRSADFSGADGDKRYELSAVFSETVSTNIDAVASYGFSARSLDEMLAGGDAPMRISRDAFADGFLPLTEKGITTALRWRLGKQTSVDFLLAHAAGDDILSASTFFGDQPLAPGANNMVMRAGVTRAIKGGQIRLETGVRQEKNAILGSTFAGPFGSPGSTTYYQAFKFDLALALGWRAQGRAAGGLTQSRADGSNGFFAGVDRLISTQFALGVYRRGAFAEQDRISLSLSQPLRIESGGLRFIVPAHYDAFAKSFAYDNRYVSLGDAPREIDLEAGYALSAGIGFIGLNVVQQFNASLENPRSTVGLLRADFPL